MLLYRVDKGVRRSIRFTICESHAVYAMLGQLVKIRVRTQIHFFFKDITGYMPDLAWVLDRGFQGTSNFSGRNGLGNTFIIAMTSTGILVQIHVISVSEQCRVHPGASLASMEKIILCGRGRGKIFASAEQTATRWNN